jgi:hypothetical protein
MATHVWHHACRFQAGRNLLGSHTILSETVHRELPKDLAALLLAGVLLCPAVIDGHHEAIFGPQSSLVLSADRFVSLQVFTRELGPSDAKTNETTTLVSAG